MRSTLSLVVVAAAVLACGAPAEPPAAEAPTPAPPAPAAEPEALEAFAELDGGADSGISGLVTFTEADGGVHVSASVAGVPAGTHGFHIHETGDCSAEDFTSAGGHFNPAGVDHGGPDSDPHHAGDLGNIEVGEDGAGELHLDSSQLTVAAGDFSVVGRGVILHANPDDLTSQPTGAAGARLGCGVVAAGSPPAQEETAAEDEAGEGA